VEIAYPKATLQGYICGSRSGAGAEQSMDYEKLALNAGGSGSGAEQDLGMCGGQELLDGRGKEKARRYWTPSEEERLYEIWGRDNWRLTRTGKNTIFFGRWAEELRDRFAVDVKPEEIQMKVNQTRAKFR